MFDKGHKRLLWNQSRDKQVWKRTSYSEIVHNFRKWLIVHLLFRGFEPDTPPIIRYRTLVTVV